MKAIAVLAASAAVFAFPKHHQLDGYTFDRYLADTGKAYGSTEVDFRRSLFNARLAKIQAHNSKPSTWRAGVNHFTDMSDEERRTYRGYDMKLASLHRLHGVRSHQQAANTAPFNNPPIPNMENFSWIDLGMMGGVKNQGACGSCWAFSATSVLESRVALANNNRGIPTLSPQQFVDCVQNPNQCGGTGGCDGATAELAYTYAQTYAIQGEYQYPYRDFYGNNTDGQRCPTGSTQPDSVMVTGYVRVPSNNQEALVSALQTGPVVVAVYAELWPDYESGIFDGCDGASSNEIDHAVVLTGMGSDSTGDWWEIRNSWGAFWGEHGVIRLKRTRAATCFTDANPLSGTVCKLPGPVPANTTVCGECGILWDPVYPTGVQFSASP